MYDSDINDRVSEIRICPLIEPDMSALEQLNFPVIFPDLPTTTFPVVVILPSTLPSILKSALEIISPTILVDDSITSTEGDEKNLLSAIFYFFSSSNVLKISILMYWGVEITKYLLFDNILFFLINWLTKSLDSKIDLKP